MDSIFNRDESTCLKAMKSQIHEQSQSNSRKKLLQRSRELLNLLSEQQKSDEHHEEAEITEMVEAMDLEAITTAESTSQDKSTKKHQRSREKANARIAEQFSQQLQHLMVQPQYLVSIPEELNEEDYLIMPQPSGKRCLVITKNSTTSSRCRNGAVLHENFASYLPNGALQGKIHSMFDCIFNEHDQTYYILDVLLYKDVNLAENSTEMRFFWIDQHVNKANKNLGEVSEKNAFKFAVVQKYPCTAAGLQTAMINANSKDDGILFIHKQAIYAPGLHPDFLLWKQFNTHSYKTCVLRCDNQYRLVTLDGYIVYQTSESEQKDFSIVPQTLVEVNYESIFLTSSQKLSLLESDNNEEDDNHEVQYNAIQTEKPSEDKKVNVQALSIQQIIPKEGYLNSSLAISSDGFGYQADSLSRIAFQAHPLNLESIQQYFAN